MVGRGGVEEEHGRVGSKPRLFCGDQAASEGQADISQGFLNGVKGRPLEHIVIRDRHAVLAVVQLGVKPDAVAMDCRRKQAAYLLAPGTAVISRMDCSME